MRKDARNIPCKNVIVCEQFYTQILTLKKQGCLEKHKDLLGGIPELLLPPLRLLIYQGLCYLEVCIRRATVHL